MGRATDFVDALTAKYPPTWVSTSGKRIKALAVDHNGERLGSVCLFAVPGDAPAVRIEVLKAVKPRTGLGSRLLDLLCARADEYGVSLELEAAPFGASRSCISRHALVAWYTSRGFEVTRETLHAPFMRREPQRPRDSE